MPPSVSTNATPTPITSPALTRLAKILEHFGGVDPSLGLRPKDRFASQRHHVVGHFLRSLASVTHESNAGPVPRLLPNRHKGRTKRREFEQDCSQSGHRGLSRLTRA